MAHYRAELTGVFGDPVDDNPTCVLEEAAYAALGLNYRYLTIKVLPEDLETAMASVRAMHFRGINLTMPHKIKVIPMLDELSEAAQIIGAVNTVVNDNGRLTGENTDGKGFTTAL
ncbi:MAG: shikimate dehydrogenase, partial [Lachnospiraceae bacterium]|nr:shikimate dehydrogenase [Lachnospiraceae bacterium]